MRIALIAHDAKKSELVEFVTQHLETFSKCSLYATGTTGHLLAQETGLPITCLMSGPQGGDLQIGAMAAERRLDVIIFLRDPLTAQAHEPDIAALLRICEVHGVALATNVTTAHYLLKGISICR